MALTVITSCADCGNELTVDDEATQPNVCPGCTPPAPTRSDRLLEQYIAAILADNHTEADKLETTINQIADTPPRLADAAAWYATEYGWAVFPLRPHTKTPATPNGYKDATTDIERIRRYWEANPHANIGLPTGTSFDVIDIDVPDGVPSYGKILNGGTQFPAIHGRVSTASGGLHLLVPPTGAGNTVRVMPGVDYRGQGGYIVAPPSWLGKRGTSWAWLNMPSPHIKHKGPQ